MKQRELADMLRLLMRERLEPEGWTAAEDASELAAFRWALEHGIEATATVGPWVHGLGEPSYLTVAQLHFGVAFEPLRRLAPLLGAEFDRSIWSEPCDDELLPEGTRELRLRTSEEVREIAERISGLVIDRGTHFASGYRTVDDLLREPYSALRTVALLAACERFDAAAASLEEWSPGPDDDHLDRVLARRLRRYIDAHGDPALIPAELPPGRYDSSRAGFPSVTKVWREGRAKDAAVKAVEEVRHGRSRESLRALLQDELARRSVTASPSWIETRLDQLGTTKAEQWQSFGRALLRAGRGVAKAIEERSMPNLEPPSWLAPPDFAGYPLRGNPGAAAVGVTLDADALEYLDRAYEALTTMLDTARVQAWLRWDVDERSGERRLAIGLGDRLVGAGDPTAVAGYVPAMDAAAVRDEVPFMDARLIRRPPPDRYLLEIDAAP